MKFLVILFALFPSLANAEEPATMGRLFFTPTERSTLEVLRQNSKAPDRVIKADEVTKDEAAPVATAPSAIRPVIMNGYISRSDGKNTVWVNDQAVSGNNADKALGVGRLNKNQVQVTVKNKSATLKPGQVYDPNTGKIYDHLSEVPTPEASDEDSQSIVDKVSKKLGLDDLKKKVSDFADSLSAKPSGPPQQ
jgi:hypothetical protein